MTKPSEPSRVHAAAPVARPLRRLSRRRLWLFRAVAAIGVPAVLLGGLELALRLMGVGYGSEFLQPVAGRADYMGNPRFGWRYFPPAIARMPEAFAIPIEKPAGVVRIFVLGESAALGDPEPAFGFSRVLEAMLGDAFPATRFEVVNASMVAINSHVIREIAADCAARGGADLFVAYIGNNEVVGPFGAGTVFSGFSTNLGLIRTGLALEDSRVVQLARRVKSALFGDGGSATEWKGMEFFLDRVVAADDPHMPVVYEHFRSNLRDICRSATSRGAGLVLCTVAVNRADNAPFASLHRTGLVAGDLAAWDALFADGVKLQAAGDFAAAAERFAAVATLDDRHAELHYRLGQCQRKLGNSTAARDHLVRARDLDGLRFRADSRINGIIREVAGELGDAAQLVDAEQAFAANELSETGIPGRRHFFEHCHLTFEGNYLLAKLVFERVLPLLPADVVGAPASRPAAASVERCAERLGLTPFARHAIASTNLTRLMHPPFTNRCDNAEQMALVLTERDALASELRGEHLTACRDACRRAVESAPDDLVLRTVLANVLSAREEYAAAAEQLRKVLERRPFDAQTRILLGGILIASGKPDEAVVELNEALCSPRCDRRFQSEAHFNLGLLHERAGRLDDAVAAYRMALARSPNHIQSLTNLGLLLRRRGEKAEGNQLLARVVEVDSEQPLGHLNLAIAAAQDGRLAEAIPSLRAVVRLQPENAGARVSLADALSSIGKTDEALENYGAALRLAPDSAAAHFGRGLVYQRLGRIEEAIAELRETLRLQPGHTRAAQALGAISGRSAGDP